MNILIASQGGDGFGIGLALEREGHEVAIAIDAPSAQCLGEGLLPHVDDPIAHARDQGMDLVLFDMVGQGGSADALKDLGIPTLGAARALDLLELDRIAGLRTMQALGLTIPDTEVFNDVDFDRAIQFVEDDGGRWVFKPCGNAGTDKTFLGDDAEEMVEYIEHERDHTTDEKHPPFILQRFVEGIEVSIERWYSQGRPVPQLDNMTFEEKKFLAGNLGPATGGEGNLVLAAIPAIVAVTAARLDRWAMAHGISGPIDLNTILDPKTRRFNVLEATARLGYPAIWAFLAQWQMPLGETFLALAEGDPLVPRLSPRMAAAVLVSVPPYPQDDCKSARGIPIVDDILGRDDYWPHDIYESDDGSLEVAGADGVVYICTDLGHTPEEAYGRCYDKLKGSRLPDRQYRTDLADRVSEALPQLRRLGYAVAA